MLYNYDQYGRLTSKQYPADPRQNATYYYDTNPLDSSGYSQNIWGRLAAVSFSNEINGQSMAYMYSYNGAGRMAGKRLQVSGQSGQTPANLDTTYNFDNQGRLQWIWYPLDGTYDGHTSPTYASTFDTMGRLSQLTVPGGMAAAVATYTAAGQLATLTEGSLTETRTYDPAMLQLTRITTEMGTDLALGQAATQSSTLAGYSTDSASSAVDGNTDGNFFDGSVTHTNQDTNAWWQVDLGQSTTISSVVVWGRTDCCGSRLSDYWVFVSNTPFNANDTPATLQNRAGTYSSHQTSQPSPSTSVPFAGVSGRYVRVQLSGTNYLSLAEVQVFGTNNPVMDMQYTYTAGQNNGRITQAKDWMLGQTTNYTYDSLNRLSAASIVETQTGEQMSYDGFGNVTGMNGAAVWTHDPATNRVAVSGWSYDGNGRVLTDGNGTYVWDVEGHLTTMVDAWQASYDPGGKMVWDSSGAFHVYGLNGKLLGTYSVSWNGSGTPTVTNVSKWGYFKGKTIGEAQARLGSMRADPGLGMTPVTYRSYGAASTGSGSNMFATYPEMGAGMYYADQRYYNPQMGKFFSRDPGGESTAVPKKPVSWNRYLYANGDPINFLGPSGRIVISAEQCAEDPDACTAEDWNSVYGTGGEFGGTSRGGGSGSGSGKGDPDPEPPKSDCTTQFGGSWSLWSGYVIQYQPDAASLGQTAQQAYNTSAPIGQWVLGWGSVESGWGVGGITLGNNNFFGWHGQGNMLCASTANKYAGCFSGDSNAGFYASGYFALFSDQTKSGVPYGQILANNASGGAAAAFQAVANAGYRQSSSYGSVIAGKINLDQQVEACLTTKGYTFNW